MIDHKFINYFIYYIINTIYTNICLLDYIATNTTTKNKLFYIDITIINFIKNKINNTKINFYNHNIKIINILDNIIKINKTENNSKTPPKSKDDETLYFKPTFENLINYMLYTHKKLNKRKILLLCHPDKNISNNKYNLINCLSKLLNKSKYKDIDNITLLNLIKNNIKNSNIFSGITESNFNNIFDIISKLINSYNNKPHYNDYDVEQYTKIINEIFYK